MGERPALSNALVVEELAANRLTINRTLERTGASRKPPGSFETVAQISSACRADLVIADELLQAAIEVMIGAPL